MQVNFPPHKSPTLSFFKPQPQPANYKLFFSTKMYRKQKMKKWVPTFPMCIHGSLHQPTQINISPQFHNNLYMLLKLTISMLWYVTGTGYPRTNIQIYVRYGYGYKYFKQNEESQQHRCLSFPASLLQYE